MGAAQKKVLEFLAEQKEPIAYWPVGILRSKVTLTKLIDAGFVAERYPASIVGFVRYIITESGRKALEDAK